MHRRVSGMREVQKLRLDENITVLQDIMGGCERIFRTPIPLSFTRQVCLGAACLELCHQAVLGCALCCACVQQGAH